MRWWAAGTTATSALAAKVAAKVAAERAEVVVCTRRGVATKLQGNGEEMFARCMKRFSLRQRLGIDSPTEIQSLAFPAVSGGSNVLIAAETGSGKTLAYLLPLVDRIIAVESDCGRPTPSHALAAERCGVQMVIVTTNQHLVSQVAAVASTVDPTMHISTLVGSVMFPLRRVPDCVVTTPSALLHSLDNTKHDRIATRSLLSSVHAVVFDEVDMLVSSFRPQIERLLPVFRNSRNNRRSASSGQNNSHSHSPQLVCAGATLPTAGIRSISAQFDRLFPHMSRIETSNFHRFAPNAEQEYVFVRNEADKLKHLHSLLFEKTVAPRALVFVNAVSRVDDIVDSWRDMLSPEDEIQVGVFHGGLSHDEKQHNLAQFQTGRLRVLVCTDLASRGIDFNGVTLVVQADFARNVVDHLHRVGRTARAGASGRSVALCVPDDKLRVDLVRAADASSSAATPEMPFSRKRSLSKRRKKLSRYSQASRKTN